MFGLLFYYMLDRHTIRWTKVTDLNKLHQHELVIALYRLGVLDFTEAHAALSLIVADLIKDEKYL